MSVAKKISNIMEQSSWIRKMFETGSRLKAEHGADAVCDFSLGNPNLEPPLEFTQTVKKIMTDDLPRKHSYMPNAGYSFVRESVAGYISKIHHKNIKKDHLIMTCGAGGALNVALKTVLNPKDTVITCTPCFVEYKFYTDNHGGVLKLVKGKEDFNLDVKAIESAITKNTAAVIINSPNNPSGRVYPESTIKELSDMLFKKSKETGRTIYLISDEPYRKIVYDGIVVPSIFKHYNNSIIVTSFSKELSIPGERIGWLCVHPEAEHWESIINGCILCNRILGFVNAPALMQRAVAHLLDINVDVERYKKKRDLLCSNLKNFGYVFGKPEGTFYLFVKAPGGDDLKFVEALQDELILTVPGRGFGTPGYFRIAYCVEDKVIENSLKRFSKVIKKIKV
jgi:aspartate aminotransferase